MRPDGPLRGHKGKEAASPPLTFRAAAPWPGDAPREDTGPPLRRQGCSASPAATARRAGLEHRRPLRPLRQEIRAGPSLPPPGARHVRWPVAQRTNERPGLPGELAFDSKKQRKLHKSANRRCPHFQGIATRHVAAPLLEWVLLALTSHYAARTGLTRLAVPGGSRGNRASEKRKVGGSTPPLTTNTL